MKESDGKVWAYYFKYDQSSKISFVTRLFRQKKQWMFKITTKDAKPVASFDLKKKYLYTRIILQS